MRRCLAGWKERVNYSIKTKGWSLGPRTIANSCTLTCHMSQGLCHRPFLMSTIFKKGKSCLAFNIYYWLFLYYIFTNSNLIWGNLVWYLHPWVRTVCLALLPSLLCSKYTGTRARVSLQISHCPSISLCLLSLSLSFFLCFFLHSPFKLSFKERVHVFFQPSPRSLFALFSYQNNHCAKRFVF